MDDLFSLQSELAQARLALSIIGQINQVKTSFLGRSAHELRSPLSSLISLLQLILNDLCENPQEEREFLAFALVAAGRLMTLIDEVVMVSKLDYGAIALDLAPVELSSLLNDLQTLTHLLVSNRNIRLKICPPEAPTCLIADRARLLQGLFLILEGAIRAQEGGEIEFWTECERDLRAVSLKVKMPFVALEQSTDAGPPPLPNLLTLEAIQDWSQSLYLSMSLQWQVVACLVQSMGGECFWEEIEEKDIKMTQLCFRFPAGDR